MTRAAEKAAEEEDMCLDDQEIECEELCSNEDDSLNQVGARDMREIVLTIGKLSNTIAQLQLKAQEPSPTQIPRDAVRIFNGSEDEYGPDEFIQDFAIQARACRLSEDSKARQLPLFLKGHALEAYANLSVENQQSFSAVAKWLRVHFSNPQAKSLAAAELKGRTMRKDETPRSYARELLKLGRMAYPKMESCDLQTFLLHEFTWGLPVPLRETILSLDVLTVDQAAATAQRLLTRRALCQKEDQVRHRTEVGVHQRDRPRNRSSSRRRHRRRHSSSSSSSSDSRSPPARSSRHVRASHDVGTRGNQRDYERDDYRRQQGRPPRDNRNQGPRNWQSRQFRQPPMSHPRPTFRQQYPEQQRQNFSHREGPRVAFNLPENREFRNSGNTAGGPTQPVRETERRRETPERPPREQGMRCFVCQRRGHLSRNCPHQNASRSTINVIQAETSPLAANAYH